MKFGNIIIKLKFKYRGNDGKCQLPSGPIVSIKTKLKCQEHPLKNLINKFENIKDPTQRVFIDEWRSLPSDEDQIADWIATNGPVTFGN